MAFGDIVQSQSNTVASGSSLSITFGSALTSGNLLLIYGGTGASDVSTTYSGVSEAVDVNNTTESDRIKFWYKVLGSGESTTVTIQGATDEYALYAAEVEGPWESSPLDLAEAEARQASGTSYTMAPAGSTSQDDEFAFAGCYTRAAANGASPSTNWDNSFVERLDVKTSNKSWHVGTRVLTTAGSVTTDCSYNTSAVAMGGMATFKQEVAGGPSPNVTDAVTLGEVATLLLPVLFLTATDAVTVGESVTVIAGALTINETDAVTVGEAVTMHLRMSMAVVDAVTLGEVATATLITFAPTLSIDVVDAVVVADTLRSIRVGRARGGGQLLMLLVGR